MHSAMPPGCCKLESLEVLAPAAHAVHLLGGIDRLKPGGERAGQIGGERGLAPGGAPLELARRRRRRFAPRDGGAPVPLHEIEEFLAALVAQDLADEITERMHVLTEPGVFGRELNTFAIHHQEVRRSAGATCPPRAPF